MTDRLRVRLLGANAGRTRSLAALVEAAGHTVAPEQADVLLADAQMLPPNGAPNPPVVALGEADPDASYAGILPLVPTARQLDAALRAAAAGLLVRPATRRPGDGFQPAEDAAPLLTPREVEVLAAIALGLSNKEIARRLGISAHTVKFHLEAAFRKLGANSRAEAVAKGLRRRLIEA